MDEFNKKIKFNSISSEFSDEWISAKKDKPEFKEPYLQSSKNIMNGSDEVAIASSGYFSEEMYIKCTDSVYVTFDKQLTTFQSGERENASIVSKIRNKYPYLTDEEILNHLNDVIKSLRLSILVLNDEDDNSFEYPDYNYYIVDPFKDETTHYSGILDTDMDGFFDYSNQNKEILYGQCSAVSGKTVEECLVYSEQPQIADEVVEQKDLTCFNSGSKEGVQRINFEASKANGLVLEEEPSVALEDVEDSILIPLRPETSKRIVLSLYQEGWDKDNTDFVRYSHFYINVSFKIAKTKF